MSRRKKDNVQPQKSAAEPAQDHAEQALAVAEPKEPEAIPAVPAGPPDGDDPLGELKASFDHRYRAVVSGDLKLLSLHKRRTTDYLDLGEDATKLKEQLGHGEWLRFLKSHGYVERTVQRAMRIYRLFKDDREKGVALTVEEAENFGKAAEKAEDEAVKKADAARKQVLARSRRELLAAAQKEAEVREAEQTELLGASRSIGVPVVRIEERNGSPLDDDELERGDQDEDDDDDQDEDPEAKWEVLSEIVTGVANGLLATTDAEREAFATFMAAIGDDDRAAQVALYHVWQML